MLFLVACCVITCAVFVCLGSFPVMYYSFDCSCGPTGYSLITGTRGGLTLQYVHVLVLLCMPISCHEVRLSRELI